MFPFGFTLEDLKAGISRVRNRVIARVFHALHLMEEWGSGYQRMNKACLQDGYPNPKWEELPSAIRVTFYSHAETKLPIQEENLENLQLQKDILALFTQNLSLPFREIFTKLSPPVSARTLRYHLSELKKKGLLISKGKGRATVWQKTSAHELKSQTNVAQN
ncbi:Uncharacterised protein [uncultured archaeon]|nr:Uncharacterised protein [uncultured archaeon]